MTRRTAQIVQVGRFCATLEGEHNKKTLARNIMYIEESVANIKERAI